MSTISGNEFFGGKPGTLVQGASSSALTPPKDTRSLYKKASDAGQDFSTGFVKGGVDMAVSTAELLQKGGQAAMAAVNPNKTYEEVKRDTGFESLKGDKVAEIHDQLKADNTAEKIGKAAEFIAELFWPVGKATEVKALVSKGKELLDKGIDKGGDVASNLVEKSKDVPETILKTVGDKTGITSKISERNVNPQAQTAFKENLGERATDYEDYYQMSSKQISNNKLDTPLGKIGEELGGEFEKVIKTRREVGAKMGEELKKAGKTKLDTSQAFSNLEMRLAEEANLAYDAKRGLVQTTKQSRMTSDEVKQLNQFIKDVNKLGTNPTASELDAFLTRVPKEVDAYKAATNVTKVTHAEAIIKDTLAKLRSSFEVPAMKEYLKARDDYARLSNFVNEGTGFLGKKTQDGDYSKDASILKSSVQSILNGGKKDWLLQLEKETGYPAMDKATVALQAMKDAGDFKGLSLLETFMKSQGGNLDLPTSGGSLITRVVDSLMEKGSDVMTGTPKERTERFLRDLLEEVEKRNLNKGVIPEKTTQTTPKSSNMSTTAITPTIDKNIPISVNPTTSISKTQGATKTPNAQGGFIQTYKGEKDLTTRILKDLEGRETVSKQYILDATNRGELKQVERDLVRQVLDTEKGKDVNVADFAKKVKAELLPLKVKSSPKSSKMAGDGFRVAERGQKYESIALPDDLRGNVKNYDERIYESPIKTSAGQTHFNGQSDNYFGHTRIEDMADNKTRRVIEVQSDLYQKGNLENDANKLVNRMTDAERKEYNKLDAFRNNGEGTLEQRDKAWERMSEIRDVAEKRPSTVDKKLAQYNDPTAHFRMVREEIKKAAEDGKTKLQFPTGETAMKIEGLGDTSNWQTLAKDGEPSGIKLRPEDLKTGQGVVNGGQDWIITDVLEDGKFKAMPKEHIDSYIESSGLTPNNMEELLTYAEHHATDNFWGSKESFDISSKVDTNNPIYRFYEKDVQKYLNKFGGKKVTDDKGVEWIEVPIKKEYGKQAVEAFGMITTSPLFIGAGLGLAGVGVAQTMKK